MNREKEIVKTSFISILANVLLSVAKIIIGIISSSIAVISDAVNNLSDALSSIITIVGTHLAAKKPDKKHPYGYGRIEYVTSMIISFIVLYAGATVLVESVKKIITPSDIDHSYVSIIIISLAVVVKIVLGLFVRKKGKKLNSDSLKASGTDALNDAILSFSVLVSAVIYLLFNVNIEAYIGIVLSIFIVKAGLEMVKDAISEMIGTRFDPKLSKAIKKEIRTIENVNGAYDLILNNYGPDNYQGSVHIEVNDDLGVDEVDKISRKVQKVVYDKFGIIIHTVGIYCVNNKDENVRKAKEKISKIVFSHEGIMQIHGFHIDFDTKFISFDIVVDFKVKERKELENQICKEIEEVFDGYHINIALDVDISD